MNQEDFIFVGGGLCTFKRLQYLIWSGLDTVCDHRNLVFSFHLGGSDTQPLTAVEGRGGIASRMGGYFEQLRHSISHISSYKSYKGDLVSRWLRKAGHKPYTSPASVRYVQESEEEETTIPGERAAKEVQAIIGGDVHAAETSFGVATTYAGGLTSGGAS